VWDGGGGGSSSGDCGGDDGGDDGGGSGGGFCCKLFGLDRSFAFLINVSNIFAYSFFDSLSKDSKNLSFVSFLFNLDKSPSSIIYSSITSIITFFRSSLFPILFNIFFILLLLILLLILYLFGISKNFRIISIPSPGSVSLFCLKIKNLNASITSALSTFLDFI